jgi:hypothetical protein
MALEVTRLRARLVVFSVVAVGLLIACLAIDVVMLLRIQQVLH